ncbi:formylglycine-generating enzyme family protein [Aquimarina aggregata]|uniref:formylglycine-generating enzyme family protein n=1 Tax=Aquimarina aggregata TaxID=1642818 RepID=UPI00249338AC|nr:formylglycine-generating enzyme family protein [Aquimarina aggregata]
MNNRNNQSKLLFIIGFSLLLFACDQKNSKIEKKILKTAPEGMVWVEQKTFLQGAKRDDPYAMPREKPAHMVKVDGFFIDITEVTNKQFRKFINATNYITIAERKIDWEEMKQQLPENTPKPHDSILQPGSLIFNKNVNAVVNMKNYGQWWTWKIGANWKHPQGPESSIEGMDNFPVVHIAYEDAIAYCNWAKRRLPTEAEWESAALGRNIKTIFTWGDSPELLNQKANTWQGKFPVENNPIDGFKYLSPVKSYDPNSIGLYDMSGNVWEITNDFFNIRYYETFFDKNRIVRNPKGAKKPYNPSNPNAIERVIKGGSFLCNASYCASFRISARMGISLDSGSDHIGFRTVATMVLER